MFWSGWAQNQNFFIRPPDNGKGVAVLDKQDYNAKMLLILQYSSTFSSVDLPTHKLIHQMKDKLTSNLRSLKSKNKITEHIYQLVFPSRTVIGIFYGATNIHKHHFLIRPILALYRMNNYRLVKYLASIINIVFSSSFSVLNSRNFVSQLHPIHPSNYNVLFWHSV